MTARKTAEPRRLGRPKDVPSAETRARLLREARSCFARNGFDATTNRQIAEAAGITPGAIYHYYASKAELYGAVHEEVQQIVYTAFERSLIGRHTLVDQFSAVLDTAVEVNRDDPSITAFVVGVASEAQRHPELRAVMQRGRSISTNFLRRIVQGAADRGELADGVSAAALEDLLNSVLSGLARFSDQTGDSRRHEEAVVVLKRFLDGTLMRR